MRTLNSIFIKQPLSLIYNITPLTIQSLIIFFFQNKKNINKNTQYIINTNFNKTYYKYIHYFPIKTIL